MKKVLLILSLGFEEIEAISVIDICRRAKIHVDICALESILTKGGNGIVIQADFLINELSDINPYDMLVLPGGLPNAVTLAENKSVLNILQEAKIKDKYLAAICAAPYVLHKAGVLNHNYTCYPSFEKKIRLDGYTENKDVIIDSKIITSRGPGTATAFALSLVKILSSLAIYDDVKKQILI